MNLSLEEYIEQYNPFGFKDKNGKPMIFKSYEEAYYEALQRLWEAGPYYVDMVLFIHDQYDMSSVDSQRFVSTWRHRRNRDREYYLFDWRGDDPRPVKMNCEEIMIGLHQISETKFTPSMFQCAFNRFIDGLAKRDKKEGRKNYAV